MRLQPNPPRLITVGVALVLGAIGLVYAWPIDALVPILAPVTDLLANVGLTMDRELGRPVPVRLPEPAGRRLTAPGDLT